MSSSPGSRKGPPRPKIQLPLPGQYYPQTGMGYVATPYGQTPIPMTPVSGHPHMMYANRASEFVFSQFKGIKDLTKSGLSVGEKCAFWLYEKVRVKEFHVYFNPFVVELFFFKESVIYLIIAVTDGKLRSNLVG